MQVVEPGRDPRLPALGPLLRTGELVAYRPTRRAVVRLPAAGGGEPLYAKVVRPGRVARLVARHRLMESARRSAGPDFPASPPLLSWSDEDGLVVLGGVAGRSLQAVARRSRANATGPATAVARSLAALHAVALSGSDPVAGGARPLVRWTARVGPFVDAATMAGYESAFATLPPAPQLPDPPRLVHGDLHDGNVFWDGAGVAVIDLDSIGAGHPATDVGNLAAHLVLRSVQVGGGPDAGRRLVARFLQSYLDAGGSASERAVAIALSRALYRLACVYALRPRWRAVCPALLAESARWVP